MPKLTEDVTASFCQNEQEYRLVCYREWETYRLISIVPKTSVFDTVPSPANPLIHAAFSLSVSTIETKKGRQLYVKRIRAVKHGKTDD